MKLTLKPWQNLEKLYFYPQSTQIAAETGLIGKLRATFGQDGSEFITSWDDIRSYRGALNLPDRHYLKRRKRKTMFFENEGDEIL